MANNKIFNLKVRDAHKILFEGEVDRLSSFNEVGPFDVYPMHANFISIIHKNLDIYKSGQKLKSFPVDLAILKVKKDVAKVFLGFDAVAIDEKELQDIQKAKKAAESQNASTLPQKK